MDTNVLILATQFLIVIITTVYVVLIYKTLKSSQILNQKIIFNEIVKQEREVRIKLQEYREKIDKRLDKSEDFKEITLDHNTILFNYYEYLAICLYKNFINGKEAKLYFKVLLDEVKDLFDHSILFKEEYSKREHYPGIQWLFKQWDI